MKDFPNNYMYAKHYSTGQFPDEDIANLRIRITCGGKWNFVVHLL